MIRGLLGSALLAEFWDERVFFVEEVWILYFYAGTPTTMRP